jgi:hypothetical protein
MELRVGIVTFHAVNNFGAVLQAYALCRAIKELGCHAEVIDYQPGYLVRSYRCLGYRPRSIFNNAVRRWRFDRFRKSFIATSERIYETEEQLRGSLPAVDVLVCGSDQVWNLKILRGRLDAGYFLTFSPSTIRRVAYAASLGDMPFPDERREDISKLLGGFYAISLREEIHSDLIFRWTGRRPDLVLDPCFLIREYDSVTREPGRPPARYLLVYPMEYSAEFTQCVHHLRDVLGLPVVNVGSESLPGADYNYTRLGPSEWLGWMRRASLVCTNSFHGTVFSIIFRRDFACVPYQGRTGLTVRIENLLKSLHLEERLISDSAEVTTSGGRLPPIDYKSVEPFLDRAISCSRGYLEKSILGTAC